MMSEMIKNQYRQHKAQFRSHWNVGTPLAIVEGG
jgi:hypothetical protein